MKLLLQNTVISSRNGYCLICNSNQFITIGKVRLHKYKVTEVLVKCKGCKVHSTFRINKIKVKVESVRPHILI